MPTSPDDLAALEDTLDLLADPAAMASIAQARREVADGRTVSADQLRAEFLRS
jgi:PHD/YefM family antitoxin component YafN of YafNO toxin-antitoxin module